MTIIETKYDTPKPLRKVDIRTNIDGRYLSAELVTPPPGIHGQHINMQIRISPSSGTYGLNLDVADARDFLAALTALYERLQDER